MSSTTITLDDDVKNLLGEYDHADHDSWSDTLRALVAIVPTPEEIREHGCSYRNCEKDRPIPPGPIDQIGGTVRWFHADTGGGVSSSSWFCTAECAAEQLELTRDEVGVDPEKVVVGGRDEIRVALDHASFFIGDGVREVGLDIPGAFGGADSQGNEYAYEGEPVYVYNRGRVVQSGMVDEIIHEDAHTALLLESSSEADLYHPDAETRAEKIESYIHWYWDECPECGEDIHFSEEMDYKVTCEACETTFDRPAPDKEDIPDVVLEYREG